MTGPGFDDLGFARPDTDREARLGLPEVVYGPGKTVPEIAGVVTSLLAANSGPVLVTRVDAAVAAAVLAEVPGGEYDTAARLLVWRSATGPPPAAEGDDAAGSGGGRGFLVAVVSAGTSDGPVAAEAAGVAAAIGLTVRRFSDVGVAGVHRLLAVRDELAAADAVVCVAGMEGALPSVLGGLVAAPVIAVPTSVGYGATMRGVTALLAMMSSCAAGVTVVNIDSGFAAAMAAHRIARTAGRPTPAPAGAERTGPTGERVQSMVHIETNVDDVTGEVLGWVVERLLAAGAADAWTTPIVMKKSRPAQTVHVLADPAHVEECEQILLSETGSLGLRRTVVERLALERGSRVVEVSGHPVRVKSGPWGAKPEHDDVVAAATALGLPARTVAMRALESADAVGHGGDEVDLRRR